MRRITALVAILATFVLVVGACAPAAAPTPPVDTPAPPVDTPTPEPPDVTPTPEPPDVTPAPLPGEGFLACQVSDTGGIDDRSFNENAWAGMEQAEQQLGVEARFLESVTAEDYARNINQFIADGCDIIITVGFLLGDDTAMAAEANPDQRFAIVDFAYGPPEYPEPPPNIEGLIYATEEAAMLAGYASASWSRTGIMGTFGGINIPPVTVFMDGFVAGANYWNQEQGANVRVLGWDPVAQSGAFTGNFDSTDDARAVSIGMLQEGADVILPVGGPIGIGTFAAIEELGVEATGLGVDVDWTLTVPEFSHLMLTHIIKRIDISVFQAIERAVMGEPAAPVFVSTLENGGVDLGPFHDYEDDITQETRDGIERLRQGIIAGEIQISDYFAP